MLRFKLPLIILLSTLLVASSALGVSTDDGKKMPLSDVPTKGLKAANKMVPGGEIKKEEESEKGSAEVWDFEKEQVGKIAKGFKSYRTGKGKLGVWKVLADNKNKVLAQMSKENSGRHFNLAVAEGGKYSDLQLSVKFKGVEGKEDQGGGPIWRALDANNYYIARWHPLEDNVRVYFVKNGRRKQLGSANVKVPSEQWHTIRILMVGQKIEAYFNGKKLITVEDGTFAEAGMVGLWTKADAATSFDDLSVKPIQ